MIGVDETTILEPKFLKEGREFVNRWLFWRSKEHPCVAGVFLDDDEVGCEAVEGINNTVLGTMWFHVVFGGGSHEAKVHVESLATGREFCG